MISHFLQSQEWEEFQKSIGRKIWRVDGVLVIKLPLALGKSYLYSAGCLALNAVQLIEIKNIAKKENVVFFKFEQMIQKVSGSDPDTFGCRKSKKEIQPQKTIMLDMTKSDEQLLSEMHSKTRYNIKLAQKNELGIRNYEPEISDNIFENFWRLIEKTTERDKFSSHIKEYYRKLLEIPLVKLFAAEYQNKIIAANIVLFYGVRATYLHGASDYEHRKLMASYFLHWETIKYAKEHGLKEYDLWGINEQKWPGVTRFKRGFGGREFEYVGSYDYIFQPFWYKLYNLRQYLRKL